MRSQDHGERNANFERFGMYATNREVEEINSPVPGLGIVAAILTIIILVEIMV